MYQNNFLKYNYKKISLTLLLKRKEKKNARDEFKKKYAELTQFNKTQNLLQD